MAHIPMDDVQALWNATPHHDWASLHRTLEQRKGKAEGISDRLIDLLLPITQQWAQSHHPFPDSPQRLYDMLNQAIQSKR